MPRIGAFGGCADYSCFLCAATDTVDCSPSLASCTKKALHARGVSMPQLARVLTAEDLSARGRGTSGLDLASYTDIIEQILTEGGVGGNLDLSPDEQQRTEKGRLTRAAKACGRKLVWRKAP